MNKYDDRFINNPPHESRLSQLGKDILVLVLIAASIFFALVVSSAYDKRKNPELYITTVLED